MRFRRELLSAAIALLPATASAQVVNFDNLANGAVVTNQYAAQGAIFSSAAGFTNYVTTQPMYNGTQPNFICSGPANSGINCVAPTYVDFLNPVSQLTFQGLGINNYGQVARARVFGGATLLQTINVIGAAEGYNPVLVNFGATSGITRLEIDQITDAAGIGWDTFSYNSEAVETTPEPATFALLAGGLIVMGGARRIRRRI